MGRFYASHVANWHENFLLCYMYPTLASGGGRTLVIMSRKLSWHKMFPLCAHITLIAHKGICAEMFLLGTERG